MRISGKNLYIAIGAVVAVLLAINAAYPKLMLKTFTTFPVLVEGKTGYENGSFYIDVEILNEGVSGKTYYYVTQNDLIVCRDEFYLQRNERRKFRLACPAAKDGKLMTFVSSTRQH